MDAGYLTHVTHLLCGLHWLLVCFWIQFKVLVVTFKILHGLVWANIGPSLLNGLFLSCETQQKGHVLILDHGSAI